MSKIMYKIQLNLQESIFQKLLEILKNKTQKNLVLSGETKDLNDLQSGVITNKVFIYDLNNKTWLTQPMSRSQMLKYLLKQL